MTIVTPSVWLSNLVKESYLKDYPVKVINNGIDLGVFKPTESDFRAKNGLDGKFIILGAASIWEQRKGIDVFIELAKRLDDRFKIVLVGTNDEDDKILPDNILSIHRTSDQKELAEIYTAADLFFNPTREENYPTVNMESIACGTPVMTFKTGGSPEIIDDKTGVVVDDDIDAVEQKIISIYETGPFDPEDLAQRAKSFSADDKFAQYLRLFASKG
jgi:glycosyltransferase involved in cell wall biosynthesis